MLYLGEFVKTLAVERYFQEPWLVFVLALSLRILLLFQVTSWTFHWCGFSGLKCNTVFCRFEHFNLVKQRFTFTNCCSSDTAALNKFRHRSLEWNGAKSNQIRCHDSSPDRKNSSVLLYLLIVRYQWWQPLFIHIWNIIWTILLNVIETARYSCACASIFGFKLHCSILA